MIGYFKNKYHIAIFGEDTSVIELLTKKVKRLYVNNNIVIEVYNTTQSLFEAILVSNALHKPFDLAVLSGTESDLQQRILKECSPYLEVIICNDVKENGSIKCIIS